MKKIFISILVIFLLCSCSKPVENIEVDENEVKQNDNVIAVWMTYYELQSFTKDTNEKNFKSKIDNAFKKLSEIGFTTVTVQVRPFADAFYDSSYFPSSKYCFDVQGADFPYDPLEIICNIAKKHSLKIEAWINPYRVSNDNKIKALCKEHPARKWYEKKKTKNNVYINSKGIYFNPASEQVQVLIVNGVKEIVKNYTISAIHFDDYFYPTTSKDIDKKEYKKYRTEGGKLSLCDFRRKCVSDLIKNVYRAVKSINGDVRFGVSPAANINENYNTLYADVEKWVSEKGYVDYICPQVYFGFKNVYQPFMFTVKKWMYISKCDMYVGLPLYKAGKRDKYAAEDDKSVINEFVNNDNIIARQINYLAKLDYIKGFYVFSYSCLNDKKCEKEVENMINAIKNYSDSTASQ